MFLGPHGVEVDTDFRCWIQTYLHSTDYDASVAVEERCPRLLLSQSSIKVRRRAGRWTVPLLSGVCSRQTRLSLSTLMCPLMITLAEVEWPSLLDERQQLPSRYVKLHHTALSDIALRSLCSQSLVSVTSSLCVRPHSVSAECSL